MANTELPTGLQSLINVLPASFLDDPESQRLMNNLTPEQQQEFTQIVDLLFGDATPSSATASTPTGSSSTLGAAGLTGSGGAAGASGLTVSSSGPSFAVGAPATVSAPTGNVIDVTKYGAVGDGKTDNTQALQKAFDAAKAQGLPVYIPAGTFNHSGPLTADGVNVQGAGRGTILNATSPTGAAVTITGSNGGLSNLQVNMASNQRSSQPQDAAVQVVNATGATIKNISTQGGSSNGIRVDGSNQCKIQNNFINGSNADGIALTAGSSNNLVQNCQVENAGDDSFSSDSYQGEKQDTGNVFDSDYAGPNTIQGRGFALMGSANETVKNCVSSGAKDYGIIAGTDPASTTLTGGNFHIENNTVLGNGAGSATAVMLTDTGDHAGVAYDASLGNVSGTQTSGDPAAKLGWSPIADFLQRSSFSSYQGGGAGSDNTAGNRT